MGISRNVWIWSTCTLWNPETLGDASVYSGGMLPRRLGNNRGMTLLIGDFNDILCNDEKEGGNYRPTSSMQDFREFVAQNELMDLDFVGYPFTWRNNQEVKPIQQRLDRGLATMG
ncbi:hypothetical protein TB2_007400 [Malus domestica]